MGKFLSAPGSVQVCAIWAAGRLKHTVANNQICIAPPGTQTQTWRLLQMLCRNSLMTVAGHLPTIPASRVGRADLTCATLK